MSTQTDAIVQECKNEAESCLYTAVSLFIWLRGARRWNFWLNVIQIVVGVTASAAALKSCPGLAAILAFLAGVLPSIYKKLNLTAHVGEIARQAGQYKNLQDRFRQAASITALEDNPSAFKTEFRSLMRRMEDLRAMPITAPEWCFVEAQKKIKAGHYDFDAEKV